MGVFSRLHSPPRSDIAFNESFWSQFSRSSKAGQTVNAESALRVAAVFSCLRVIAEGVAQVPFKLFLSRPGGAGSDPAIDHPNYRIAYRRPNSWQTSFEFRENLIFQAGLLGDFYSFKNMVRGGKILKELIPFPPGAVSVRQDPTTGKLFYNVTIHSTGPKDNGRPVESREFPAEVIWHVRGPSWDTLTGMETLKLAREAIGLSLATEEAHSLLHANGGQAGGMYAVDGTLTPEQHKQMSAWVNEKIVGSNRFSPLILDRNAKFTPVAMSGVDSEHLATRNHQIYEICRHFRVIPLMVGLSDKTATYASAEQMFIAHVVHTLSPWYERIEQSADINLLTEEDQDKGYYYKFNAKGLMRGAVKDQAIYLDKMYRMKAISPNEIRALDELNPYTGGEKYFVEQGQETGGSNEEDNQA